MRTRSWSTWRFMRLTMSRRLSSSRNDQCSRSICPYPDTIVTRFPISWPRTRSNSSAERPASGSLLTSCALTSRDAGIGRARLHDLDERLHEAAGGHTLLQIGDGTAFEGDRRHARLFEPGEDDDLGVRGHVEDLR